MNPIRYEHLMGETTTFDPSEIKFDLTKERGNLKKLKSAFQKYGAVAVKLDHDFSSANQMFEEFYGQNKTNRPIDPFNGVNFCVENELPAELIAIENVDKLNTLLNHLLTEEENPPVLGKANERQLGILGAKLIVKDHRYSGTVFLHQDSCYQFGHNRVTVFFLLSDLTSDPAREATVRALIGTHKFGHLGDAGEIDRSILDADWPEFQFALEKNTYVLMNPHLWHYSNSSQLGKNDIRAIYTFTVTDLLPFSVRLPGSKQLLPRNAFHTNQVFKRSRVSQVIELQEKVASLSKS